MKKVILFVMTLSVLFFAAGEFSAAYSYTMDTEWSKGIGGGKVFAVEDIDNDGIMEAVMGRGNFLQIFELRGGEWVEQWHTFLNDWYITSAKIGDVDGDGTKDIVATTGNSYDSKVFILDTTGRIVYQKGGLSYPEIIVKLCDTDNDGKMEILSRGFSWYSLMKVNITIDVVWSYSSYQSPPVFKDIDNDGIIEIVAAKDTWDPALGNFTGHTISVFSGATYGLEWEDTALDGRIMAFTTGDLDKDGVIEIATVVYSLDMVTEYMNVYDGVTKGLEWTDGGVPFRDDPGWPGFRRKLIIADVNSDGANELINGCYSATARVIEIYNGQTKALEGEIEREGLFWDDLYILDIDSDGRNEIVTRNGHIFTIFDGATRIEEREVELPVREGVYMANIDADPQLEIISDTNLAIVDGKTGALENEGYFSPSNYSMGDIDGDGVNEILFTTVKNGVKIHIISGVTKAEEGLISLSDAVASAYLFLGNIDADMAKEIFFGTGTADYIIDGITKEIIWQGAVGWTPVALSDVDNDTKLEVLSASEAALPAQVYDLETKEIEWELPGNGSFVEAVDVDSDGVTEIIRGTPNTGWQSPGSIYIVDARSHQIEWSLENISNGIEGICVYDIDRDGSYEILYGEYGGRINILDGPTKVLEGSFNKAEGYLHGLAAGDVDDDGDNEIIATNGLDAWNYLFIFDGVTYAQEWKSSASLGTEVHDINIIDADSDGINEIIAKSAEYLHILGKHINKPPVLYPIGNKKINEAEFLEFTISATDPEGDLITYIAEDMPAGASFNPATKIFSWIPTRQQSGLYEVTFKVSDAEAEDSEKITITVKDIPPMAPSGLILAGISATAISFTWKDNSVDESGFIVYRKMEGSVSFSEIKRVGANVTNYADSNLLSGTEYSYKVQAYNGAGKSGDSNILTARTAYVLIINSTQPAGGAPGADLRIYGKNFGQKSALSRVYFKGAKGSADAAITSWTNYNIACKVPNLPAGAYDVRVVNASGRSNAKGFQILLPQITSVSPASGKPGARLGIYGNNFGQRNSSSRIVFDGPNGRVNAVIISWSNTTASCSVPNLPAGTYSVRVITGAGESNGKGFRII